MIQARFVYDNCLYGWWTEATANGPMMVPNPEYAHRLLGVEFKESANEPQPRRPKPRSYKTGTVPNGEDARFSPAGLLREAVSDEA